MRGFIAHRPRGSLAAKRRLPPAWGEAGAGCRPLNSHTLRLVTAHRDAGGKARFGGMAAAGGGGIGEVREWGGPACSLLPVADYEQPGPRSPTGASASRTCARARAREGSKILNMITGDR